MCQYIKHLYNSKVKTLYYIIPFPTVLSCFYHRGNNYLLSFMAYQPFFVHKNKHYKYVNIYVYIFPFLTQTVVLYIYCFVLDFFFQLIKPENYSVTVCNLHPLFNGHMALLCDVPWSGQPISNQFPNNIVI